LSRDPDASEGISGIVTSDSAVPSRLSELLFIRSPAIDKRSFGARTEALGFFPRRCSISRPDSFKTDRLMWGADLARLLPDDMASRLRGTAERVGLHEHDVLIVADASGKERTAVDDLGKSLGAALAVARVKARHDGDEDLAQLLDLACISPESGAFRVEVGLPLELLRRRFGHCAEDAGSR
jgi:hypothetical protein